MLEQNAQKTAIVTEEETTANLAEKEIEMLASSTADEIQYLHIHVFKDVEQLTCGHQDFTEASTSQ